MERFTFLRLNSKDRMFRPLKIRRHNVQRGERPQSRSEFSEFRRFLHSTSRESLSLCYILQILLLVVRKAFDNDGWCLGVPLRISVIVVDDDYILRINCQRHLRFQRLRRVL